MTSSKISQIAALMRSTQELTSTQETKGKDAVFGAFLSQTAGRDAKQDLFSMGSNLQSSLKAGTDNQAAYEKAFAQTGYRGTEVSKSGTSDIQDKLPDDVSEKLKGFEEKVTEKLSEKLGISEEEIAAQMEAMGLTALDLTDSSKLASLVMQLTGSDDIGGLLLSEDFQQILGDIGELTQDLMAQLNLTPEEMKQFVAQPDAMVPNGQENDIQQTVEMESVQLTDENDASNLQSVPKQEAESGQNADTLNTSTNDTVVKQEAAVNQEVSPDAENSENSDLAPVVDAQESNPNQEAEADAKQNDNAQTDSRLNSEQLSKNTEKSETGQTHVTYQTTMQNVGQGQLEVTQTIVQTRIDIEDIIRQVSQMTRVVVNQAESSIEMQLNPANLGKVYLQVVSREGVITAQLAAQNEAVKQALENQVAALKENMNQQGLKVEAIEVTIASHEFERNLEENQQNAAKEQQNNARRSSGRNLNSNNMDELEGLMSEEENLVAKMMSEQGNSVDLTA